MKLQTSTFFIVKANHKLLCHCQPLLLLHIRGYLPLLSLSVCTSTFIPCISTASKSTCNKDLEHKSQRSLMCIFNVSIWATRMSLNIFSTSEDNGMQSLTLCFSGLLPTAYSKSTSAGSAQLLQLPKPCNCHSCYSLNWAFRFILQTVNNFFIPYLEEDSECINYLPCKSRDINKKNQGHEPVFCPHGVFKLLHVIRARQYCACATFVK